MALAGSAMNHHDFGARESFRILRTMLGRVLKMKPAKSHVFLDEMTNFDAEPEVWVAKWVDYSDKYGFVYQLSDQGLGVMFNDNTESIMLTNGKNVRYIDRDSEVFYITLENYPRHLHKKMQLLAHFTRYMSEIDDQTRALGVEEVGSLSHRPHLQSWHRFTSGVLMQLNNGTVQIDFNDHTKVIMSPVMGSITYIDEDEEFKTFGFMSLESNGCSQALHVRMEYAYNKIRQLLDSTKCPLWY